MADNIMKGVIGLEVQGVPAVKAAGTAVDQMANKLKAARTVNQSFNQVLREAPAFAFSFQTGIVGISNNLPILADAFRSAKAAGLSTMGTVKELGKSLLSAGSILSIASLVAVQFGDRLFGAGKSAKEAADNMKKLSDATKSIFESAGKEAAEVSTLIAVLKSETETRERKLLAIKELQKIQPEVFNGLKLEGNAVSGLDAAYQNYIANLRTVIAVKIRQAQLEQLITKQLQLQGATLTNTEKALFDAVKGFQDQQLSAARQDPSQRGFITKAILGKRGELAGELNQVQADIDFILKQITELSNGVKLDSKPNEAKVKVDKIKPLKPVVFDFDLTPPDQPKLSEFADVFASDLNRYFNQSVTTDFSLLTALAPKIKTEAQALGQQFGSILSSGFQDAFAGVGEGIGNALSGQSFGSGLTDALGSLLSSLGKALIQFGIVKEGLDKLFGPGGLLIPGAVAIGLGVLAIAAGKAISNFGGGRATGGPVGSGQSYLVGENGPEIFRPGTTGSIIPNGNLGSFGGGGLSGMMGRVVFEISANKLIGVMANGNRSQAILV